MRIQPTEHVNSGDPLKITAGTWNTLLEVASLTENARDLQSAGTPSSWGHPCLIATIKNTTANDLTAGSILSATMNAASIGTFPAKPHETRRRPYVNGIAPTIPLSTVAVLVDPIGAGKYGRATVLGVTVCEVNVTSQYHKFAAPYAGTDRLISSSIGPATILHKESTTGVQKCIVLLTNVIDGLTRQVRCTSNTVTDSMQPGVVIEPGGDGTWSDGATCKMRKSVNDQFRSGGTYPLYLSGWNGTEEIFGGPSSTSWEFEVCVDSATQTNRAWLYGYFEEEEDV